MVFVSGGFIDRMVSSEDILNRAVKRSKLGLHAIGTGQHGTLDVARTIGTLPPARTRKYIGSNLGGNLVDGTIRHGSVVWDNPFPDAEWILQVMYEGTGDETTMSFGVQDLTATGARWVIRPSVTGNIQAGSLHFLGLPV